MEHIGETKDIDFEGHVPNGFRCISQAECTTRAQDKKIERPSSQLMQYCQNDYTLEQGYLRVELNLDSKINENASCGNNN